MRPLRGLQETRVATREESGPQPAPSRARTLEAGERWARLAHSAFLLGWPWEAQSSPRVARESWGWRFEFPRETGLILRFAGKAGNPFQTTQGNRLSCRDQEGTQKLSVLFTPRYI